MQRNRISACKVNMQRHRIWTQRTRRCVESGNNRETQLTRHVFMNTDAYIERRISRTSSNKFPYQTRMNKPVSNSNSSYRQNDYILTKYGTKINK